MKIYLKKGTLPVELPAEPVEYGVDYSDAAQCRQSPRTIIRCADGSVIAASNGYSGAMIFGSVRQLTPEEVGTLDKLPTESWTGWRPAYEDSDLRSAIPACAAGWAAAERGEPCPADPAGVDAFRIRREQINRHEKAAVLSFFGLYTGHDQFKIIDYPMTRDEVESRLALMKEAQSS